MSASRDSAFLLIALVFGASPEPAGALPRAADEVSRTAPISVFDAAGAIPSAERLRRWLARSLTREGLTVRRRGEVVEIDPRVSIRILQGILARLPGEYRVHVVVDSSGPSRSGVLGQITSRIVLQREDSRITQRLNAVRAFSFSVERNSDGWGTAPQVALGFDLPSSTAPFTRVEIHRAATSNAYSDARPEPVRTKSPRRKIAAADSASKESPPLVNSADKQAPDELSRPAPAAGTPPIGGDDPSTTMAGPPDSGEAGLTPATNGTQQLTESVKSGRPAAAAGMQPPAAAGAFLAPAKHQAPATAVTGGAPASIDSVAAGDVRSDPWPARFRLLKARASAQRREESPQASPLTAPEMLETAPESDTAAPRAQPALETRFSVGPETQGAVVHAQAGLPLAPLLLLPLAGIALGVQIRLRQRQRNPSAQIFQAAFVPMGVLPAVASEDTNAQVQSRVTPMVTEARESMSPSTATQILLHEEIRRTAEAIRRRGESTEAERLLEIVAREQRRRFARAA